MMSRYIAFLRAINVGGHHVNMKELCGLFEDCGLSGVESFIASGNVIFTSSSRNIEAVEKRIETHLGKSLGYEVKTFVRTEAEVAAIAAYAPFTVSRMKSAVACNVAFLDKPLDAAALKLLMTMHSDIDDFHVHGREVYWLCRKKQSESKFSNAVFEKTLKI